MDQMFDLVNKDFKAAILYKELEDMFKNFKENMFFNVWTECLSRKIKTTQKKNKKEILKVKNIITKWKFYWIDITVYWRCQENNSVNLKTDQYKLSN